MTFRARLPPCPAVSDDHMHERPVRLRRAILAKPARLLRRIKQAVEHVRIAFVAQPVAIEVVHAPIVVFVDEDVHGRFVTSLAANGASRARARTGSTSLMSVRN